VKVAKIVLALIAGSVLAGCGAEKPQSCPAKSKRLDKPNFDHPLASSHTYPTLAAASRRLSFKPVAPRALGTPVRFDSNGMGIALVFGITCADRFVVVEVPNPPTLPDGGLASARKITSSVGSMIAWNERGITFTVAGPAPSFTPRKAEQVARILASHAYPRTGSTPQRR
jgi:hypothetical protein